MFKVCVASYVGVIGQNAELCDVDNFRGLITGTLLFLRLEDATGRRLAGPEVPDRERGERRAAALQRAIDKGFDPTTSAAFQPMDPAYGSAAYQADFAAGLLAEPRHDWSEQ